MTNNKEKKVLNVPNLRFPEFTDKWEAGKLEEYILLVSGQDLSSEQYTDKEDVYPYITGASSLNSEGIILNRWTHTPTQIVKRGDILLVCKGSGVGQLTVLSNVDKAHIARQIMGIRAKNTESQLFIYHYLSRLMTELKKRSTGIIPGIDRKSILSLHISIPSLQEQQKVAELLSLIEQRIITQNKIIEDLKKLKSAISKHLFTRKDLLETTICLSEIATLRNGYAFQSSKYNALGKWKILTITNVSGERHINDEDCNCIINLPDDIQNHQVLKEGDILISLTGNVGRVSLCKDGDYLLNQRVGLLQLAKNVNQEFLYQILSSQKFENSMIACGQGAAQMNIGKGDVESYVLPYSSNVNNILLVAKILHSYDEYIINEQRKLTLLTMQKQYFLAQMFI